MDIEKTVRRYIERVGCASMSCKAALIDMDGVLYDSMPNHVEAWYRTIAPLGIDCCREEFFYWRVVRVHAQSTCCLIGRMVMMLPRRCRWRCMPRR